MFFMLLEGLESRDAPEQQPENIEVLHSNERPGISAVFGATLPPSGLSGAIRRKAFKFSEGKIEHWLALLLADRVNVVEGLISDLSNGHVPNIFAEKGWTADWQYNKKAIAKRVVVGALVTSALVALLYSKNKKKKLATP